MSKVRCINGLSCVIQYSHGMLEVRVLVTILSLFDAPSLLNISMRAEVSTLRKVVMTGHEQPLMGRPRE